MDQQELQKNIAQYYSKLSPNAQQAFSSMQWMDALQDISARYKLNETEIESLGTETTLALLGIISLEEYEENLVKDVSVSKETAGKIVGEIKSSIFSPIREDLEQAHVNNLNEIDQDSNKNQIDPQFADLPENVQEAIRNSDYQKKLYAIGTKYKLQIARMASLEKATVDFIKGKLSSSQYENNLALETDLPADKVKDIVSDVNIEIMQEIRKLMKGTPKEDDDAIPLPPYAQAQISNSQNESGIYAEVGIEMLDRKNDSQKQESAVTMKEDAILAKSGISMIEEKPQVQTEHFLPNTETQKQVLDGIENPVNVASSIIGEKLGGITTSKNAVSDYSLPKMSSTPTGQSASKLPGSVGHDPYHEPIE